MPDIDPTAIVDSNAVIADDVQVGPFCRVGPGVTLGGGTRLVSHVSVLGRTTLGKGNTVWPFASLGGDPQDLKYNGEDTQLIIGNDNDIREGVTIHKGTEADRGVTTVGDGNLIMAYAHIGHDCIVGNRIVITNAVQLAGHVRIEDHVGIGGGAGLHHFVTVGRYAFIGGMSRIVADVPPFMFVEGHPARVRSVNTVGLTRHGFDDDVQELLKEAWRMLFKKPAEDEGVGHSHEAMIELTRDHGDKWYIRELVDFLKQSSKGTYGRYREAHRTDDRLSNPVR